jgi:hypothetical protein
MMNVYRIINSLGAGIHPTPSIMGRVPKSFHSCPKPQTRTWCGGSIYAMEGKIK